MIILKDLHKRFGQKVVFNGLNLTITKGESIVVIGGSGVGKSVLLKHIIGLMKPDSGSVTIDGKDVSDIPEAEWDAIRLKFAMVFQGAALFDSLSVWENVGFGLLEHSGLSRREIRAKASEKLGMVGLDGAEDLSPAELSGGMRKRAAIARAIAMDPEVILYDEPTTGLDPILAAEINQLILKTAREVGATSITITHDMVSAYTIADKIAMLYNGVIIQEGTPAQIQQTANPIVRQFIEGRAEGPITRG
jgi:phospholipid/cholesterol/gamma-HCH transport system ATP-binding protein